MLCALLFAYGLAALGFYTWIARTAQVVPVPQLNSVSVNDLQLVPGGLNEANDRLAA